MWGVCMWGVCMWGVCMWGVCMWCVCMWGVCIRGLFESVCVCGVFCFVVTWTVIIGSEDDSHTESTMYCVLRPLLDLGERERREGGREG